MRMTVHAKWLKRENSGEAWQQTHRVIALTCTYRIRSLRRCCAVLSDRGQAYGNIRTCCRLCSPAAFFQERARAVAAQRRHAIDDDGSQVPAVDWWGRYALWGVARARCCLACGLFTYRDGSVPTCTTPHLHLQHSLSHATALPQHIITLSKIKPQPLPWRDSKNQRSTWIRHLPPSWACLRHGSLLPSARIELQAQHRHMASPSHNRPQRRSCRRYHHFRPHDLLSGRPCIAALTRTCLSKGSRPCSRAWRLRTPARQHSATSRCSTRKRPDGWTSSTATKRTTAPSWSARPCASRSSRANLHRRELASRSASPGSSTRRSGKQTRPT